MEPWSPGKGMGRGVIQQRQRVCLEDPREGAQDVRWRQQSLQEDSALGRRDVSEVTRPMGATTWLSLIASCFDGSRSKHKGLQEGHGTEWSAWDSADHGVTVKINHCCKLLQDQRHSAFLQGQETPHLSGPVYGKQTQMVLGPRQALQSQASSVQGPPSHIL